MPLNRIRALAAQAEIEPAVLLKLAREISHDGSLLSIEHLNQRDRHLLYERLEECWALTADWVTA